MPVVLGIIVEIVVVRDYLYGRKGLHLPCVAVCGHRELPAADSLLHQHRRAFGEREFHGGDKVFRSGNLGHTEAGTALRRFHEYREPELRGSIGGELLEVHALAHEGVGRHTHAVQTPEVALAGILVEGYGAYVCAACIEGYAEHFEIALHEAVLPGGAVLDYIGILELHLLSQHSDREVVLVHFGPGAFGEGDPHGIALLVRHQGPFPETCIDFVDVISVPVKP